MARAGGGESRWRKALAFAHSEEYGWLPAWNLFYLGFLFFNGIYYPKPHWLEATLLSIAVFLPVYFDAWRRSGPAVYGHVAVIALLGYALICFNVNANTYLIYASALLPHAGLGLRKSIAIIAGGLALLGVELWLIHWPLQYLVMGIVVTALISMALCAANHFQREKRLRQAELKLSHDEVRRLAALAERERIGRDLHDLLGHTLSLITLKSELASRLFELDPSAARREIAEVERVARDALAQVRRAVSGIRAAGLGAELASARLLLESSDIRLDYRLDCRLGDVELPPPLETVLALTVREAITNIQRHAQATSARVELAVQDGEARLSIEDDGRGGAIEPGNGLLGMHERLRALGGRLEIHSARGSGARLLAVLPLPEGRSPQAPPSAPPLGAALR